MKKKKRKIKKIQKNSNVDLWCENSDKLKNKRKNENCEN